MKVVLLEVAVSGFSLELNSAFVNLDLIFLYMMLWFIL